MSNNLDDIIIGISTALSEGAISIIRLSGEGSVDLVNKCFKGKNLCKVSSHTINYGFIVDETKEVIDEVLVSVFKAPKTYTTEDVVEISDFVGSTSEIIDFATASDAKKFIICTEMGVFYELEQKNPDKKFYSVGHRQFCPNMKRITLEKVKEALENLAPEVSMEEEMRVKANAPLERMLDLAK